MSQGVAVGDSGVVVGDDGVRVDDDTQTCCCETQTCTCPGVPPLASSYVVSNGANGYLLYGKVWIDDAHPGVLVDCDNEQPYLETQIRLTAPTTVTLRESFPCQWTNFLTATEARFKYPNQNWTNWGMYAPLQLDVYLTNCKWAVYLSQTAVPLAGLKATGGTPVGDYANEENTCGDPA